MIDIASWIVALQMEGWGKSVGVRCEIGQFRRVGKLVEFMRRDELVLELGRAS